MTRGYLAFGEARERRDRAREVPLPCGKDGSRKKITPTAAVTTKPIWVMGTSTLASPRAKAFEHHDERDQKQRRGSLPRSARRGVAAGFRLPFSRRMPWRGHEHDRLAGNERGRVTSRRCADLVEKIGNAHCRHRDERPSKRGARRAAQRHRARIAAQQQPDRAERSRKASELPPGERLAEQQCRERGGDDEAQAENRRDDAKRTRSSARARSCRAR